MKTFKETINEGKLKTGEGMKFVISVITDTRGIGIQFIPDGKTLEGFSKNEQIDSIQEILKKKLPDLAESLWFESGNLAAGLVFRLNVSGLTDMIEKALK